jgi:hypothetical protein
MTALLYLAALALGLLAAALHTRLVAWRARTIADGHAGRALLTLPLSIGAPALLALPALLWGIGPALCFLVAFAVTERLLVRRALRRADLGRT